MASGPILHPPPAWGTMNTHVVLWHGCVSGDVRSVELHGVDPLRGHPATDFGRGFYTTTVRRQARYWAWQRSRSPAGGRRPQPVALRFRLPLVELAGLNSSAFVLGDNSNERFWSFVHHCRGSTPTAVRDHLHPDPARGGWYDMVVGPVAAFWEQSAAMLGADQISFHTPAAADVLNRAVRSGDPSRFRVFRVRPKRRA